MPESVCARARLYSSPSTVREIILHYCTITSTYNTTRLLIYSNYLDNPSDIAQRRQMEMKARMDRHTHVETKKYRTASSLSACHGSWASLGLTDVRY
jgi:hypothetical protein